MLNCFFFAYYPWISECFSRAMSVTISFSLKRGIIVIILSFYSCKENKPDIYLPLFLSKHCSLQCSQPRLFMFWMTKESLEKQTAVRRPTKTQTCLWWDFEYCEHQLLMEIKIFITKTIFATVLFSWNLWLCPGLGWGRFNALHGSWDGAGIGICAENRVDNTGMFPRCWGELTRSQGLFCLSAHSISEKAQGRTADPHWPKG